MRTAANRPVTSSKIRTTTLSLKRSARLPLPTSNTLFCSQHTGLHRMQGTVWRGEEIQQE
jgi:hypothetical protein